MKSGCKGKKLSTIAEEINESLVMSFDINNASNSFCMEEPNRISQLMETYSQDYNENPSIISSEFIKMQKVEE